MTILQSFILGLIQALTEFFPVSSSAHLKIAKLFFGLDESQNIYVFDLCCHFGTLFAVLFFLKNEIISIFTKERLKILYLFIAMLPLIPAYFILKPLREFASQSHFLGPCLIITGFILFAGHYLRLSFLKNGSKKSAIRDSLAIGAMQSAALIPGISRSASTISCAKAIGWQTNDAVRFSFLLSIPTILGGNAVELLKLTKEDTANMDISLLGCLVAFMTSLIVGLFMIRLAIKILDKGNLKPFAFYCCFLGIITWALLGG